ncbi:hypothetical protein CALCODRAFT_513123, partial [Calocera cornea HHB12733]
EGSIPLLGFWAARMNWGNTVADEYEHRSHLEFALDRIQGTRHDTPLQRRGIVCKQVVATLLAEVKNHVVKRANMGYDVLEKMAQRQTRIDPHGSAAQLAVVQRQRAAMEAWTEAGGVWDKDKGYKLINRALGNGTPAAPTFPWCNNKKVSIHDICDQLVKMAEGNVRMAIPVTSQHSVTIAVLEVSMPMLSQHYRLTIGGNFRAWLCKGLALALEHAHVDLLPWASRTGRYPSVKEWVRVDYQTKEAEQAPQLSDELEPEDEEDAVEAHILQNQMRDMEEGDDWSAIDPMNGKFYSVELSRRKLSEEMRIGIEIHCTDSGPQPEGMDFPEAYKRLKNKLMRNLKDPMYQYFIFLATIFARIYPRFRYLKMSAAEAGPLNTAKNIRDAQRRLKINTAPLKAGQRDVNNLIGIFLLFCVYRSTPNMLQEIRLKTNVTLDQFKKRVHSNKDQSCPLFCNFGLYRVIGKNAKMLANGAPEDGNFYFKTRGELLEDWSRISAKWSDHKYVEVLDELLGPAEAEYYRLQGKCGLPPHLESSPSIPDALLDRRHTGSSTPRTRTVNLAAVNAVIRAQKRKRGMD